MRVIIVRTGVIDGVVQSAGLLALERLTGDEVADVDHIAQLANLLVRLDAFEEVFGLFVEQVESFPRAAQTQIGADDTDIRGHDLADLFDILRDEHALFVGQRAFVIPCRHLFVEIIAVNDTQTVLRRRVGIDHGFD